MLTEIQALRQENKDNGFGYLSEDSTDRILRFQETRRKSYGTVINLLGIRKKRSFTQEEVREFVNAKHDTPGDRRLFRDYDLSCIGEHSRINDDELLERYHEIKDCLHAYKNELKVRELVLKVFPHVM